MLSLYGGREGRVEAYALHAIPVNCNYSISKFLKYCFYGFWGRNYNGSTYRDTAVSDSEVGFWCHSDQLMPRFCFVSFRPPEMAVPPPGKAVLSMGGLSHSVIRVDTEEKLSVLTVQDVGQVMPGGTFTITVLYCSGGATCQECPSYSHQTSTENSESDYIQFWQKS